MKPLRNEAGAEAPAIVARIDAVDWTRVGENLDQHGNAVICGLLTPQDCDALAALYDDDRHFRSRIVMARHGFGRGEYKYFAYPLPDIVAELRTSLYPPLATLANRWNAAMGIDVRYPDKHAAFLKRCHEAGQTRPTPLLLRYGEGDYNCLHQDLYGEHVFPLQVAFLLSQPRRDFEGGEFVLTEQRPRMQSRAEVVPLARATASSSPSIIAPCRARAASIASTCATASAASRAGRRHTLGVIFHDAR